MEEKILKVEGMMCGHCEATVKAKLEEIENIEIATADHNEGTVVIRTSGPVDDAAVAAAITDAGFRYIG